MAKVRLYGVQDLDFDTKEGDHIRGIKLHYGSPNQHVYGERVDTKFISASGCEALGVTYDSLCTMVGEEVNFDMGLSGEIVGISLSE